VGTKPIGTKGVIAQLANVPLFSGCSQKDLQTVARAVKDIKHKAGTVVAREGDPGVGLFIITDGSTDVTVGGKPMAKLGPGDFFGEIALLDGGPRTATVTAVTDIRLLGLTEWVFRGLMVEHAEIAVKVLQSMAGRLRTATKEATA
jgi:CRP-like cAMP-binding protein